MLLRRATRSLMLATAALALPAFAGAQGFGLNEIGSCAVGRSYAVTAGGCSDASLIYWNPAGTTHLDGWSILAGAAAISVKGAFTRDTTGQRYDASVPTSIVPHLFVNYRAKDSKLAYGAGLYVPYGLTSQWDQDFPGRFTSQKASLQTIYVQPNVAYQINKNWSVGGGPIWAHSSVELRQSIDLSSQTLPGITPATTFGQLGIAKRTEFGRLQVKGDATGFGAQVGIMGKLNDNWTFGVRYLAPITFKYDDADATFTQIATGLTLQGPVPNPANPSGPPAIAAGTPVDDIVAPQFAAGGALVPQTASTTITHPAQAQIGFGYSGFKDWNLEADFAWIGWNRFHELPVTFANAALSRTIIEDYNNSSSLRLGAERSFSNQARLRFGVAGSTSAAPDATVTPLLPEMDRGYFTIGGSYPFMSRFTVDGSFAHIATNGSRGRIDERYDRSLTAQQINSGAYSLSANVFSLSLKASY